MLKISSNYHSFAEINKIITIIQKHGIMNHGQRTGTTEDKLNIEPYHHFLFFLLAKKNYIVSLFKKNLPVQLNQS